MLTVVVVVVAAAFKKSREQMLTASALARKPARQAWVPWFLCLFITMVVLNSVGVVPTAVQGQINDLSRACLVVAIAALGMKTSSAQLVRAGWQPLLLIVVETLWIALFVLGVILMLH